MQRYALINASGAVENIVQWDGGPDWQPPTGTIAVQSDTAAIGDTYANGIFTGPAVPAPTPLTPAQQLAADAALLLSGTVTVTSTSTPALDGSYSITAQDQQHIAAEVQSLMLNGTFADGTASVQWPDATGALHTFDAAQFKAFATAVGGFVAACIKCRIGTSTTLPSASVTIA